MEDPNCDEKVHHGSTGPTVTSPAAQAFQDPNKGGVQKGTRTLEINPRCARGGGLSCVALSLYIGCAIL